MSNIHNIGTSNNNNGGNNNGGNNGNSGTAFPQTPDQSSAVDDLVNYNKLAARGKFTPIKFRDGEIEKILTTLITHKHPNVLLIGEAGVGKTGIVEELARRIVEHDPLVCKFLGDKTIYEMSLSTLAAGKKYVGELEEATRQIIEFATDPKNNVILFIDEMHNLSTDHSETSMGRIAETLKPALARGELHVIGATTIQESRTIQKDAALNRRFNRVNIPELTIDQTVEILKDVAQTLSAHHNVNIREDLLPHVVRVADAKMLKSNRPDNAITLLDHAASEVVIKWQKNLIANPMIIQSLQGVAIGNPSIQIKNIEEAVVSNLNLNKALSQNRTQSVIDQFDKHIVGQEKVVTSLVNTVKRQNLKLTESKRPRSYIFAGPTGTGKSEIAKQLANGLFGDSESFIYLNMTEYVNPASISRIIGSNEGYVGSTSKRKLPFDDLETNPYQVILIDEFEKAHKDVQLLFMQALDEGFIETNRGNRVEFKHSIIIATTNAGVEDLNKKHIGFGSNNKTISNATTSDIIAALCNDFPPELLNRFENVIAFDALTEDEYKNILKLKYNKFVESVQKSRPDILIEPSVLDIDVSYQFIDKLSDESFNPLLNGRPAERTVHQFIEDTILDNPNQSVYIIEDVAQTATLTQDDASDASSNVENDEDASEPMKEHIFRKDT